MFKKCVFATVFLAVILGLIAMPASANWPKKPIKIMIPWPAGNDPSTMVATAMAPHMSEELQGWQGLGRSMPRGGWPEVACTGAGSGRLPW